MTLSITTNPGITIITTTITSHNTIPQLTTPTTITTITTTTTTITLITATKSLNHIETVGNKTVAFTCSNFLRTSPL